MNGFVRRGRLLRFGRWLRFRGGLARRCNNAFTPVVTFRIAPNLRFCSPATGSPGLIVVTLDEPAGFRSFAAERFRKASLFAGFTEVPLAVLAFLIVVKVAGLDACVTVVAFDVPAAELGWSCCSSAVSSRRGIPISLLSVMAMPFIDELLCPPGHALSLVLKPL